MSKELAAECPAFSFLRWTGVGNLLAARSRAGEWTRWRVACKVAPCNLRLSNAAKGPVAPRNTVSSLSLQLWRLSYTIRILSTGCHTLFFLAQCRKNGCIIRHAMSAYIPHRWELWYLGSPLKFVDLIYFHLISVQCNCSWQSYINSLISQKWIILQTESFDSKIRPFKHTYNF